MFEAAKPCVVQLQNDEASSNISWLDVVKERNYQAEYEGNGIYHFHMQERGDNSFVYFSTQYDPFRITSEAGSTMVLRKGHTDRIKHIGAGS